MENQIERMTSGACVAWNGEICKADEFRSRMKYESSKYNPSKEELERIKDLPYVPYEKIEDLDNPEKYEWYQVGQDKYGRFMYCPKTDTRRSQTMGEFYGNSVVD